MTNKPKRGRWKAGESGNPAGRPKGLAEVTKLRQAIGEHIPQIVSKLVEQALGGDVQASRLLLERTLPVLKPTELPIGLPLPDGDLPALGVAVLQAAFGGLIAPSQAAALLTAMASTAKLTEPDPVPQPVSLTIQFVSPGSAPGRLIEQEKLSY